MYLFYASAFLELILDSVVINIFIYKLYAFISRRVLWYLDNSVVYMRDLILAHIWLLDLCSYKSGVTYSMWQKEQAVSISTRNGWFWIKFHNLARDPNSHIQKLNFPNNRFHHILGYGSGPPQATVGPYAHHVRDIPLQHDCMTILPSTVQNVFPHVGACVQQKPINRVVKTSPFAGPIRY
jgi:hypothetical protein